MVYDNAGGKQGTYIPDFLTKCALNFVKNNQPDSFNHYRPFFLLLNYKIPGDGKYQVPTDAPFSEEKWPQPEKNKAAMIARLDGYIGQLQEQLQKLGLTNNTAVFFTSDTISKKAQWHGSGIFPQQHFNERFSRADDCPLAGPDARRSRQRFQMVGEGFSADGGGHRDSPNRPRTLMGNPFCRC